MYIITDHPKLVNIDSGLIISISNIAHGEFAVKMINAKDYAQFGTHLHKGTRQECEDFIYSLAGYVGAVKVTE